MKNDPILGKLNKIDGLPTLPVVAMEVNTLLEDYTVSAAQLAQLIEKDPSLTSRILRLVNSSFYGLRSKICNIPHAIMLLGFNTVRNAVVSVAIIDTLSVSRKIEGLDMTIFWKHSAAVSVLSKYLAKSLRIPQWEDAFIAGLIHDMGKIIMARYFPEEFKACWARAVEEDIPLFVAEKQQLGTTHAEIGAFVAEKWKLPEVLTSVVKYHHRIRPTVPSPPLLMAVHSADILINNSREGQLDFCGADGIQPEAADLIKPALQNISEWGEALKREIDSAISFFLRESKNG